MVDINKIYNENCLDTMNRMSNNFIDLTITSPPYDNLRDYKGYSFDFENIAKELFRVTKEGGVVVWVVADSTINGSESGTSFKQALYFKEIGFNLHDTMIYSKSNPLPLTHNRYEQQFEFMFVLSKGKPKTFNPILKQNTSRKLTNPKGSHTQSDGSKKPMSADRKKTGIRGNIFEYTVGYSCSSKDKIAFKHPAIFPEQLVNDQIISWSNKNDLIYDPFMGSGTTAKMCILNKRNYVGSEISEEYYTLIYERIKDLEIVNSRINNLQLKW